VECLKGPRGRHCSVYILVIQFDRRTKPFSNVDPPACMHGQAHEASVKVFRIEVGVQKGQSIIDYRSPSHTPLKRFTTKGLWRWRATCEYAMPRPSDVITKTSEKLSEAVLTPRGCEAPDPSSSYATVVWCPEKRFSAVARLPGTAAFAENCC